MAPLQLLGTAWTVWKLARKRLGPVGALVVTAVVIGGMVYLTPWLAKKFPALAGIAKNAKREKRSDSE